jgi:NitT/TauT family transport system ATP-binding protein
VSGGGLRLVIHAPTAAALERARRNARNFRRLRPEARLRIVANGEAVAAALDAPDAETDGLLELCGVTLARLGRPAPLTVRVVEAAVVAVAEAQAEGWSYLRA